MRCNIPSVNSKGLRSVRPLNDPYGSNELNKPLTDRYNAGVLDNPQAEAISRDLLCFIFEISWLARVARLWKGSYIEKGLQLCTVG